MRYRVAVVQQEADFEVSIWDDHELQDYYAGAAPGGGLRRHRIAPPAPGRLPACFESMPASASGR